MVHGVLQLLWPHLSCGTFPYGLQLLALSLCNRRVDAHCDGMEHLEELHDVHREMCRTPQADNDQKVKLIGNNQLA